MNLSNNNEMVLGGVVIPRGSSIAFNYVGANSTRFRDFSHVPMVPLSEAAALPQWERNVISSRLRFLARNNEYVAAIIGAFSAQIGASTLRATSKNKPYNNAKEDYWLNWQDSCEVSGLSLAEVETILHTELLCAGELFFLKLPSGKIQLVPSEYVFSTADAPENEIQGITYDGTGNPTGYRIGSRDSKGRLVPAEKLTPAAMVGHVYRRDRIEQLRGVPWLASAVNALQDLQELVEAKVLATKTQSLVAAVVTKNQMSATPNLGDGRDANGKQTNLHQLKSGSIYYLEAGEEIKPFQSVIQANDFDAFLLSRLRAVCASIGLPLELAIEGFRDSNYSSARSTNLQWGRRVKEVRRLVERKLLEPLNLWQSERARAQGVFSQASRKHDREVFFGFPALPAIDAQKETEANIKALENGLTTYSEIYAERNLFFEDEMRTRAHDARVILDAAKAEGIDPAILVPSLALHLKPAAPAPAIPAAAPIETPPAAPVVTP